MVFLCQFSNQIKKQVDHFPMEMVSNFNPESMAHLEPEYPFYNSKIQQTKSPFLINNFADYNFYFFLEYKSLHFGNQILKMKAII
jgi:hypothetical protein